MQYCSHEQLYIHICMQKHIQHNKDEWTQFFRKIYLSLYWKGCVWEVSWRPNKDCKILTPANSSAFHSLSFPFSWAAQPEAWGPSLCWDMVLIPASSVQLVWTSCRRGYIIIWRPPTSCERHNSHSIQPFDSPGCPPISSTGCTCYLHRCISHLTAWLGSICNTRIKINIMIEGYVIFLYHMDCYTILVFYTGMRFELD